MKYIITVIIASLFIVPLASASNVTSAPTCTLTASPTPVELLKTTPVNFVWTSTGGTSATLRVDAWSQPNIYSTTGLSGNVTVPVLASMGLTATLTVSNTNGGMSICKMAVPTFWTVRK